MVICLEQGADLHMVQLIPVPLTVSCSSKIQIGFTFLVTAHPGSPGQRAVKCVCVRACVRAGVCVSIVPRYLVHNNMLADCRFLMLAAFVVEIKSPQCCDAVGWASRRASGL